MTDGASDDVAILAECAEVYQRSKRFEAGSDKSAHWNVFPTDFARCFDERDAWKSLLRNAITVGFNDDTFGVEDRWQRRQRHDYSDLVPHHCRDPEYSAAAKAVFKICVKRFGLRSIESLLNTQVGSPRLAEFTLTVVYPGEKVERSFQASQHDLSLAYFCGRIRQAMMSSNTVMRRYRTSPTFVEIGGGVGELAAKMKIVDRATRSIIFDLPELGAIQCYYLKKRFPGKTIYTIREFERFGAAVFDQPFDFLLLPPALIKLLPVGWPSIVANIRSFQEMSWLSVVEYFVEIQRVLPLAGMFCCINRTSKKVGEQDIDYDRFPFDDRWRTLGRDMVPFQAHIVEGIFERI